MDLRQRLAIGTLGLGYLAMKRVLPQSTAVHERLREQTALLAWNRNLVIALSDLMSSVDAATDVAPLLRLLNEFCTHDRSASRAASFHMNRLAHDIDAEMGRLLRAGRTSLTTQDLREQLYVERDVVPVVRAHLEGVLHNHMLRELM